MDSKRKDKKLFCFTFRQHVRRARARRRTKHSPAALTRARDTAGTGSSPTLVNTVVVKVSIGPTHKKKISIVSNT